MLVNAGGAAKSPLLDGASDALGRIGPSSERAKKFASTLLMGP